MAATPDLTNTLDNVRALHIPENLTTDEAIGALRALRALLTMRNLLDHLTGTATGVLNRLGVPAAQGRTPREMLITLGCAPAVAARLIRIGAGMPALPGLPHRRAPQRLGHHPRHRQTPLAHPTSHPRPPPPTHPRPQPPHHATRCRRLTTQSEQRPAP